MVTRTHMSNETAQYKSASEYGLYYGFVLFEQNTIRCSLFICGLFVYVVINYARILYISASTVYW